MTHTEFGIGSGHALQDEEVQSKTFTQLQGGEEKEVFTVPAQLLNHARNSTAGNRG